MSGKVRAYAHFGVTLRNEQWSWSGRAPDGRIVLSIWKDQINYGARPASYNTIGHPRLAEWQDRQGNRERIEHLKECRDKQNGIFHVVIVTAKDPNAEPREIDEAYPTKLTMRLVQLNETTGEFSAEVVSDRTA